MVSVDVCRNDESTTSLGRRAGLLHGLVTVGLCRLDRALARDERVLDGGQAAEC